MVAATLVSTTYVAADPVAPAARALSSLDSPAGLAVQADYAALGAGGSGVAVSQSLVSGAALADSTAVTGLTWQSLVGTTLGSAVLSVGGWYGTKALIGDDGVTGVTITPQPGWTTGNAISGLQSTYASSGRGWLNATIASHVLDAPAYGASGDLHFRLTGTVSGTCVGESGWDTWVTPAVHLYAVMRDTTNGARFDSRIGGYGDHNGASLARNCSGPLSYTDDRFERFGTRYTFDHIEIHPWYSRQGVEQLPIRAWYPPGHSLRPPDPPEGQGTITQRVQCADAKGATHMVTATTTSTLTPGTVWEFPDVLCPSGSVASEFGADWTPSAPGAATETLIPTTHSDDWVTAIPTQYPQCLTQTCYLQLNHVTATGATTCGKLAVDCPDWYTDRTRAANYQCTWGPYTVDLHRCSAFRDPGVVLPNATANPDGTITYTLWPPLDLASAPVARRAVQLLNRYGPDHACVVLGEAIRALAPTVSVADIVTVCRANGVPTALTFTTRTHGALSPPLTVQALVDAATGTEPLILEPECMYLADNGTCLDDGEPGPEPTPEPDPSGAGIGPPPSCIEDPWVRGLLVDSMPEQDHHMATKYNVWGQRFQRIADKYGLSVKDSAMAWNLVKIPHRGPHPVGYHQWVLDNMLKADAVAKGDVAVFTSLYKAWVVDVVKADPSIVRYSYWNCEHF